MTQPIFWQIENGSEKFPFGLISWTSGLKRNLHLQLHEARQNNTSMTQRKMSFKAIFHSSFKIQENVWKQVSQQTQPSKSPITYCMFRTILFTIGHTTFFYKCYKLRSLNWDFYQLNYGEGWEKRLFTQPLFILAKIKENLLYRIWNGDPKTVLLRTNWAVVASCRSIQLLSACLTIL